MVICLGKAWRQFGGKLARHALVDKERFGSNVRLRNQPAILQLLL
jgi:hypothetical protein